jgi:glycosyltransferase involved in cell wall biosynthesis
LIIAGGTDCVSFPGIGYGNFYRPILRDFTKWSYQLSSHICPKHDTLWFTEYNYDSAEPYQQGIKAFAPTIQDKYTVIRNGYDPEKWPLLKLNRKPKSFITVSGAFEYPFQVQLKGIDLILEAAVEFPDYHFTIAGVPEWKNLDVKSNNVTILPPIPHNDLHRIFNEHEYYLQLSMAEGFPNALCEAMLCGCTPIVSNVFSMPEITGNTEMAISIRNAHELTSVLKKANTPNESTQHTNRKLINERYQNTERTRELEKVIKRLVNQ